MNKLKAKGYVGNRWTTLLVLCVSIGVSLSLAEIGVRIVKPPVVYPQRTLPGELIFSTPPLEVVEGVVRYSPSSTFRQAAAYGGKLEWEIVARINNLGFRDDRDYPHDSDTVVLGDSFAFGDGGTKPWVPELGFYNMGMSGYGIEQMETLLRSIRIPFRRVLLVAISDDFYRRPWRPVVENGFVRYCPVDKVTKRCFAGRIDSTVTPTPYTPPPIHNSISRNFKFGLLLKRTFDKVMNKPWATASREPELLEKNMAALSRMVRDYPQLIVIHVPQKEEVAAGKYFLNPRIDGARYIPLLHQCMWTKDMFYENDPHPNDLGYQSIKICVSTAILDK